MLDDVRCGPIPQALRAEMAWVIDSAFAPSLQPFLPDRTQRLRVLADGVNLHAAIGAWLDKDFVGVVGLKSATDWVFDGITFGMLRAELGVHAVNVRIALEVLDRPLEAGTMRIEFLAVEASSQGRGVGGALLRAAEQHACAEGATLIELHVDPTNTEARHLYHRQGFHDSAARRGTAPRRWLQNQTDIRMTKEPQCTTC